ncbi:MAG: glycerophosphodiester phosphodiesterase, partial [Aeromonas veronii]
MQIIAHRGASGLAPENTLKAMAKALELGASAIEIDVQAADGELWVFHDRRLERCTNGKGVLTEQSRAYLEQLDAGEGEVIPTLWQVM